MNEELRSLVADKVDRLSQAEDAVIAALEAYRGVLARGPVLESTEITYKPSPVLIDSHQYEYFGSNGCETFRYDGVVTNALNAEIPALQVLLLSLSPHWEDRIRAAALNESLRGTIKLPDGFPCIYEPAGAPVGGLGSFRREPFVWVASADEDMLRELFPLYQELWTAYENQWPESPNRKFVLGHLDGISPSSVVRPGTTAEQVIGQTMITHPDIYKRAPEHLRQMHPRFRKKEVTA